MTEVQLQFMAADDRMAFREMVEHYWRELMPDADVMQGPGRRDGYFEQRFRFDGAEGRPYWTVVDGQRVGFLMVGIVKSEKRAMVQDFYVRPEDRRKGYGSTMVRALYQQLDARGVQRVDLDVRRDNPGALAFWEAQRFRIALFRLRQYRDPKVGRSYIGALSSDFAGSSE